MVLLAGRLHATLVVGIADGHFKVRSGVMVSEGGDGLVIAAKSLVQLQFPLVQSQVSVCVVVVLTPSNEFFSHSQCPQLTPHEEPFAGALPGQEKPCVSSLRPLLSETGTGAEGLRGGPVAAKS